MSHASNANWELSSRTIQAYINDVSAYEDDAQRLGDALLSYSLGQNRRRLQMLQIELNDRQVVTHDMVQKFEELVSCSEKYMYLAGCASQNTLPPEEKEEEPVDPNQTILFQ